MPTSNLAIVLKGNNVHCNCCDGNFITFLPFGLVKRANALCPGCGALERHRLHWHYMLHQTNLLKTAEIQKMLHVAPESVFFDKFNNAIGLDYTPCAKVGEGYSDVYPEGTINVDITEMQFEDNSFDIIYCSHVLEHVIEDVKAMKEFYRVLKPGGWAMLQVPIDKNRCSTYEDNSIKDPKQRERIFGQYDHVRIYGTDYPERLKSAGFQVNPIDYVKNFSESEIFKFGFEKNELIYYCTKSVPEAIDCVL
ncbi:MAG: methyltransferase domain-containing protein [Candidatus Nitrosocosmicus sp.]